MVASQQTLDALEDLGLNLYERKIYVALLSRGVSTAGELSEMTNVPRSRTYDVLESLAEKGFSVIKPSKPLEYVAIPPEEALENAKEEHREEFEQKVQKIENFKDTDAAGELVDLYNKGVNLVDPSDISGALKGRYNVYQHFGNMMRNADEEVRLFTTEQGLLDLHEHHKNLIKNVAEQGVNVRILAPHTENNRRAAEALEGHAEIRTPADEARMPEGRMLIVDDEKLAFSLTEEEVHPTQDTAFWTESPHAASNAFGPVFEHAWENAQTVH